jgi:Ca-activated chloride channel homolog
MAHSILDQPACPAARLVAVDGRTYPLESARITARAAGGIALTTLAQTYGNPHDEGLEVLYTLPLPADGAVLGYTIRIGEKLIRAEVQPREQASEAYREALFQGQTAGLLEQTRLDTLQQRLGNIPPRTRVEIEIDVMHPLAFLTPVGASDGAGAPEWEYRFPTVVGVRYLGAEGRVPDAGEVSPDRAGSGDIPTRFEMSLVIGDAGAGGIHSPSHAIELVEGGTRVSSGGGRLDRDVVVRWAASSAGVGVRVVEGRGLPGDDGRYALITVVPPAAPEKVLSRDLTVLLDASGSMSGAPLELAKQVIGELLQSLEDGDRFELLAFSNDVRPLTRGLTPWSPKSLRSALDSLVEIAAGGGTEMRKAIEKALAPMRGEAQRQVVLVTDGYIGFEAEVVGRIADQDGARVHAVGIGSAPNRTLTQQAAAAGRGLELLVGDARSAREAARRLIAGTARPVLTNITLGGGADTGERPARLRDVFAGQPLVFTAELAAAGGALEIAGRLPDGERWTGRVEVPAAGAADALAATPLPIGALHGRSLVAELEIGRASGRDARRMESRIEALGMRHKIATSRTSLVAIAEEPAVDPRAPRRRERLAVEVPSGVSAEGTGLFTGQGMVMAAKFGSIIAAEQVAAPASPSFRLARRARGFIGTKAGAERVERHFAWLESTGQPITVEDVRWAESDVLIIELRVPFDGFRLPEGEVLIHWDRPGQKPASGSVLDEAGTPPGPHQAGMLVRLAVRIESEPAWPAGETVRIEWESRARDREGDWARRDAQLSVRVPDEPRDSSARGKP